MQNLRAADTVEHRDRALPGPSRATVVIGLASLGAVVGFFTGAWIAVAFLGIGMLDHTAFLMVACTAGAATGWLLGALIGSGVSAGARPTGRSGAWVLRVGALLALVGEAVLLSVLEPLAESRLHAIRVVEVPWLRLATVNCAVLAAATLLAASFRRRVDRQVAKPGPLLWLASWAGIALLSLMLVAAAVDVRWKLVAARERQMFPPVLRTLHDLLDAAGRYEERRGVFPPDASALLATGARIRPGVELVRGHPYAAGFCLVVGRDTDGDGTLDIVLAGIARPRSDTSGRGATCAGVVR